MLEPRHIMNIKLDRSRLLEHMHMPPPRYAKTQLISQFAAIGDAAIGSLLHVAPTAFRMQLETAREFGAAFLTQDAKQRLVGVTASTSLIRTNDDILSKNLIVPRRFMWRDPRLSSHCIVGVFVRGTVVNGVLDGVDNVEVAGWATIQDIAASPTAERLPEKFQSKLAVLMMPCAQLRPIATLLERVTQDVPMG